VPVKPGDTVNVNVTMATDNAAVYRATVNGTYNAVSVPNSQAYYYGGSAEWIVERPTYQNVMTDLANFGTITFTQCQQNINSDPAGVAKSMDSRNGYRIKMWQNLNTYATPVATSYTSTSFQVKYGS
jgi:hypothetical protein